MPHGVDGEQDRLRHDHREPGEVGQRDDLDQRTGRLPLIPQDQANQGIGQQRHENEGRPVERRDEAEGVQHGLLEPPSGPNLGGQGREGHVEDAGQDELVGNAGDHDVRL